jgi:hypothetical protein
MAAPKLLDQVREAVRVRHYSIRTESEGGPIRLSGVLDISTPAGFRWMTTWEPRYQPAEPSFSTADEVAQRRVLGTFLFWEWRY